MPILSLLAKLGLDKTGFDAGLAAANKGVNKFGSGLKGQLAGAFGAAAFVGLTRSVIEYADSIDELSERLGVSTQLAQEYAFAAKLGGSDSEFFAKKFEVLREAMAKGPEALEAFGISASSAEGAIEKLSEKIRETGLNTEEMIAFVDLFGKNGGKMINVLSDLGKAREQWMPGPEAISEVKNLADSFTQLGAGVKNTLLYWTSFVARLRHIGPAMFGYFNEAPSKPPQYPPEIQARLTRANLAYRDEQIEKGQSQKAEIDELNKIRTKTAGIEEKTRQAAMTEEEKINSLLYERSQILREINYQANEVDRAKMQQRLAEITFLTMNKDPAVQKGNFNIDSNPLGRMGAFIPSNSSTPSWAEKQIAIQDAIKKNGIELLRQLKAP